MSNDNENEGGITADTRYKESDEHVPNPNDLAGQYLTGGYGYATAAAAQPAVGYDRVKTAEQIVAALDPDDDSVSESVVIGTDEAKAALLVKAEATIEAGYVVGGPNPDQIEAAQGADEDETGGADDPDGQYGQTPGAEQFPVGGSENVAAEAVTTEQPGDEHGHDNVDGQPGASAAQQESAGVDAGEGTEVALGDTGTADNTEGADGDDGSGSGDDADDSTAPEEELKGAALDAALEERGLSKSGNADEKRARVAEYDAEQAKNA